MEFFADRAGQRLSDVDTLSLAASGSATILAAAAVGLGAQVSLLTAVGNDGLGAEWKRRVAAVGVDIDAVSQITGQLTPIAISTVDLDGEKTYSFYRFRGICDPLDELVLSDSQEAAAAEADVLVVTEAALRGTGSRRAVEALLARRGRERGPTVLAVNFRADAWSDVEEAIRVLVAFASRATVVCCNRLEYELLAPAGLATDLVYETSGAEGVRVHTAGNGHDVPARAAPRGVVLDTGAGDTFCAAVAVALAEGRAAVEAAEFATAVAALAISRSGLTDAAPSRQEVDAFLRADAEPHMETV